MVAGRGGRRRAWSIITCHVMNDMNMAVCLFVCLASWGETRWRHWCLTVLVVTLYCIFDASTRLAMQEMSLLFSSSRFSFYFGFLPFPCHSDSVLRSYYDKVLSWFLFSLCGIWVPVLATSSGFLFSLFMLLSIFFLFFFLLWFWFLLLSPRCKYVGSAF